MEPYKYLPLNEANEEIRMITLHPSPFNSPIRVSLSNVQFPKEPTNKSDIPEFEALSYAWGPADNPVDIIVQSTGDGEGSLSVTPNLAAALPYLRYPDKSRTIWIDAIAVNQKDLSERSSQVRRMADIYTKACRVIVWLGPEATDTALALEYISDVSSRVRADWDSWKVHATGPEKDWADPSMQLRLEEREASALLNLFSSSWFERLWIWQEIRLAQPNSIVACGSLSIPWESVRTFAFLYATKEDLNNPSGVSLRQIMGPIFHLCNPQSEIDLESLLDRTKNCKYTDPRDRIFALLSMFQNYSNSLDIEPDYTKTVPEVYKNAVIQWSTFSGHLSMLQLCSLDKRLEGAPSWVPNFMIPDSHVHFYDHSAAAGTSSVFTTQPGNVLEVLGLSVARIRDTGPTELPCSIYDDIRLALKSIMQQFLTDHEFSPESKRFQSMCRVVVAGFFAERWDPPREDWAPRRDKIRQVVSEIWATNFWTSFSSTKLHVSSIVGDYLRGRTVFLTDDGHLGLGPETVQVGDIVTIFLGMGSPMILRPGSSQFHEIVGEAYCDGVMNGEALLGPFPGRWEPIIAHNGSIASARRAFVDRDTGITQADDPRLGDLPEGWNRKFDERERFSVEFVNDAGEVSEDPRLLPEALRERGVDLNIFKLV